MEQEALIALVKYIVNKFLIEFDVEKIKEAGYPVVTPVLVTNTASYLDVVPTEAGSIQEKENLITVVA